MSIDRFPMYNILCACMLLMLVIVAYKRKDFYQLSYVLYAGTFGCHPSFSPTVIITQQQLLRALCTLCNVCELTIYSHVTYEYSMHILYSKCIAITNFDLMEVLNNNNVRMYSNTPRLLKTITFQRNVGYYVSHGHRGRYSMYVWHLHYVITKKMLS